MGMMDQICTIQEQTRTRSISSENITGGKGQGGRCELEDGSAREAARDLGKGWKVNPYTWVEPGETAALADVSAMGAIKHIWITSSGTWRDLILRFYWDGSEVPAVECPMGDFFASGWGQYAQIASLAVCVNPSSGFNCYWTMPFRSGFKVTLENRNSEKVRVYYQITYEEKSISEDTGYFHAQFRRINPLPYKGVYTLLDNISGKGQFVGTYVAWGVHNNGWWGEGEMKFYLDGDGEYPTICGTGTEDYFGGSWDFIDPDRKDCYKPFTTPYSGLSQIVPTDGCFQSQLRFGMYRWHITDPIRFTEDIRITLQALGWRSGKRYLPLQDDIASVAYFYLDRPYTNLPQLLERDGLEII